jgi:Xaa-Pro aminopeptidase
MTRTLPVDPTFSSLQKELYDVVHRSHLAAIAALKPGIKFLDLHLLACRVLVEGLVEVGIMKGHPEDAVAAGAHTMFFQCGLGHLMGLDVHDMENFGEAYVGYDDQLKKSTAFGLKSLRLGKALAPGYVLTVEPGIYIIPELIKQHKAKGSYNDFINYPLLEKHADFGGIRIEDDFVITVDGAQLLGTPLASSSDDIESIRKAALS